MNATLKRRGLLCAFAQSAALIALIVYAPFSHYVQPLGIAALLVCLYKGFSNHHLKALRQYLATHPQVHAQDLKADFSTATPVEKGLWIGDKWTFYLKGCHAHLLANADLIWCYRYSNPYDAKPADNRTLTLKTRQRKTIHLVLKSSSAVDYALHTYAHRFEHMVVGYSSKYLATYENCIRQFIEIPFHS